MWVGDTLFPLPPVQIGICHLSDNRPWTNKRNLSNQIVKAYWVIAWQRCHLSATFDLKHSDGVSFPNRVVNFWAILGKMGKVNIFLIVVFNQTDAVLQHRHHSQTK